MRALYCSLVFSLAAFPAYAGGVPTAPDVKSDPVVKNGDTLPRKAKVGEKFAFRLGSEIKGGVAFVGMKGPKGLDLQLDGRITWTPTQDQVGAHELKLQFSGGGKSEFQTYTIVVEGNGAVPTTAPKQVGKKDAGKDPEPSSTPASLEEIGLKDGATLPKKAVVDQLFTFDLAPPESGVKFQSMFNPKGLQLSPEGKVTWTPTKGMVGSYPLRVQIRLGNKQEMRAYTIVVDGNPGRSIATLPLGPPGGWVMTPDNKTLIVSQPDKAQLVYFDTVADKEVKRVDVDFQPSALALQGKRLFAAAKGSSMVYALDAATGAQKSEFTLGSDAVSHLACHPTKGLLYASTTKFAIYAIDPETGKVSPTAAKGDFLAVDPGAAALYAGIQPARKDEFVWKEDASGRITAYWDTWGTRGLLLKYAIQGRDLKKLSAQNNAAVNGWDMHLTPDGKRIMLVGGGGWRPKDQGAGGGYVVAMFNTANLEAMVGQAPHGLNVAFHPVLNLGVTNIYGKEIVVFNGKSLVKTATIPICQKEERRPLLLTFGGQGAKVILWNGDDSAKQQGLHFIPLDLTPADRTALSKAYGSAGSK